MVPDQPPVPPPVQVAAFVVLIERVTVWPTVIVLDCGVMLAVGTGGGGAVTVRVWDPVTEVLALAVAVIVAVPAATPAIRPPDVTVATAVLLDWLNVQPWLTG
jgi:hypothetical protein